MFLYFTFKMSFPKISQIISFCLSLFSLYTLKLMTFNVQFYRIKSGIYHSSTKINGCFILNIVSSVPFVLTSLNLINNYHKISPEWL